MIKPCIPRDFEHKPLLFLPLNEFTIIITVRNDIRACALRLKQVYAHSFYRGVHLVKKGGTAEVVKCLNIFVHDFS